MAFRISKLLTLLTLAATPLTAEIQQLEMRYNPAFCTMQCPNMLLNALRGMPAVAEVTMNAQQGQAILRYKPNQAFDFWAFKRALQSIGSNYDFLRIKVRGTITGSGKNFNLISIGDNTKFVLLGPIQSSAVQYTISPNLTNHPLTPYLIESLERGVKENRIAVIQGWLFEPDRNPPYYIVIEQMNYVVNQEQNQNPPQNQPQRR